MSDLEKVEQSSLEIALQEQQLNVDLKKADLLVKSGLLPTHIKTPEACYLIMQQGKELGVQPLQALNNIAVINNKTVIGINLGQALVIKAGGTFTTIEDFRPNKDGSDFRTVIEFERNGKKEQCMYLYSEAIRAGVASNTSWQKFPRNMMYARCWFIGARRLFADVLQGMYDIAEIKPEVEITENSNGEITYKID